MKISFIGTHGVGKTGLAWTLAGNLKKGGHSVDLLPEAARIIADSGLQINESSTEKAQNLILKKQISMENFYSLKCEILVCDRAVIDNFVYLIRVLKKMGLEKTLFNKKIKFYENIVNNHLKKYPYDYLFHVPIITEKFNVKDLYRSKNPEFRKEIDILLKDYLKNINTGENTVFTELPKNKPNSWNRIVRDTIKLDI